MTTSWAYEGPFCANVSFNCEGTAVLECPVKSNLWPCTNCYLVKYCSKKCQKQAWPNHQYYCQSELASSRWRPSQEMEKTRQDENVVPAQYYSRFVWTMWGNMPAINIMNGPGISSLAGDLDLCFAASGDLRNMIETFVNLPENFNRKVRVVLNDIETRTCTATIILLFFALSMDLEDAPIYMLHLWYSAALPGGLLENVKDLVHNILESRFPTRCVSADRIIRRKKVASTTWAFGNTKVNLLTSDNILEDLHYKILACERDMNVCSKSRQDYLFCPFAADEREFRGCSMGGAGRIALERYITKQVLLPWGGVSSEYTHPNPLLFDDDNSWLPVIASDPKQGWSEAEVRKYASENGIPKNDAYGSLHAFVLAKLRRFCERLRTLDVTFVIQQEDARELPNVLRSLASYDVPQTFHRIEVSNICDLDILGPAETLSTFGPLLKPSTGNFTPVIIGLLMKAIDDIVDHEQTPLEREMWRRKASHKVAQVLDLRHNDYLISQNHLSIRAQDYYADLDTLFTQFKRKIQASKLRTGEALDTVGGMRMRAENEIVPEWPTRLKRGTLKEERDEIYRLAACGGKGWERNVEWVKA